MNPLGNKKGKKYISLRKKNKERERDAPKTFGQT